MAEIANFSAAEQDGYEESLKYYRDLNNVVDTSRQEGMQEGFKRGQEAGRQAGREEGQQEARRQMALQMRAAGLSVQDIASYTGLSVEAVEAL